MHFGSRTTDEDCPIPVNTLIAAAAQDPNTNMQQLNRQIELLDYQIGIMESQEVGA